MLLKLGSNSGQCRAGGIFRGVCLTETETVLYAIFVLRHVLYARRTEHTVL